MKNINRARSNRKITNNLQCTHLTKSNMKKLAGFEPGQMTFNNEAAQSKHAHLYTTSALSPHTKRCQMNYYSRADGFLGVSTPSLCRTFGALATANWSCRP